MAIVADILSYISQGIRWQILLRPVGRLSWLRTSQAVYAGLFANEVLPMRFGELVRAWLISRWTGAGFVRVIPSMAVERLFDGIWLILAIGAVSIFIPLPKSLLAAADILGIFLFGAAILTFTLIIRGHKQDGFPARSHAFRRKPLSGILSFLARLAGGVHEIGVSPLFYLSFAISFLVLAMQAISFWLVMLAYHIQLSLWIGAAVFLIVHFGTAIPNAPSNVGSYQFFTVLGLSLFGVDKTTAAGFSVVVFIILTAPLWIIGYAAVIRTGLTLSDIRAEISRLLSRKDGG